MYLCDRYWWHNGRLNHAFIQANISPAPKWFRSKVIPGIGGRTGGRLPPPGHRNSSHAQSFHKYFSISVRAFAISFHWKGLIMLLYRLKYAHDRTWNDFDHFNIADINFWRILLKPLAQLLRLFFCIFINITRMTSTGTLNILTSSQF